MEERFGKYIIEKRLGIGGMAEVFRCRLKGLGGFDKHVVVKRILPEHLDDPSFVEMFLDEARIAANLSHPNIIQVFEIDEVDGIPFIAMEYVRGPTLSQVLREARRQGKTHLGHPARILSAVCDGLHYAHGAKDHSGRALGIVHRDVTPQNILISLEGVPKIVDFGVAKARGRLATTQAGILKGKLRYMPPEQLRPGHHLDHRADVFAAGVCLYRATTGRFPFDGASEPEVIHAVLEADCPRPTELVAGYPEELERVVLWALQKDPEARCPSARALHEAIEGFLAAGSYPRGTQAVAGWLAELFPDFVERSYSGAYGVPGTPVSGSSGASGRSIPGTAAAPPPSPPNEAFDIDIESTRGSAAEAPGSHPSFVGGSPGSHPSFVGGSPGSAPSGFGNYGSAPSQVTGVGTSTAFKVAVSLGAVGLLAAVGVIGYLLARPPPTAAPPPVVAASVRPQGPNANANATAYLNEAARLAKAHRFKSALALLAQARQAKASDAAVNIRLANLEDKVETDAALASAERYLAAGNTKGAVAAAKDALDRDPDDVRALDLLKRASVARAAASASPAPAHAAHRQGRLAVSSTPAGALVYVDDVPVGRTPLRGHRLAEGRHAVEIRLRGYETEDRHVRVRSGRRASLQVHLARGVKRHLAAAEVVEASQPDGGSGTGVRAPGRTAPKAHAASTGAGTGAALAVASPPAKAAAPAKAPPPPAAPPPAKVAEAAPKPKPKAVATGPTPAHPLRPRLPTLFHARSMKDLARAVGAVENETVNRAGVPRLVAQKVGAPLLHALVGNYSPGTTTVLFPKAMYYRIVHEVARGTDAATIGQELKRDHFSGAFQAHPDPAP